MGNATYAYNPSKKKYEKVKTPSKTQQRNEIASRSGSSSSSSSSSKNKTLSSASNPSQAMLNSMKNSGLTSMPANNAQSVSQLGSSKAVFTPSKSFTPQPSTFGVGVQPGQGTKMNPTLRDYDSLSYGQKLKMNLNIGSMGLTLAGNSPVVGKLTQTTLTGSKGFVVNTKAVSTTTNWLAKVGAQFKNPMTAIPTLMAAVGSYPFAGFIKEEALQTLGFAVNTALQNDDLEGAELATQEMEEILDPNVWSQIINKIPFANVISNLKDFFGAARTKLEVDKRIIADKKNQLETGQSDAEYWNQRNEEQTAQEQAAVDYYNQERQQLIQWELEARANAREEEARFWEKEREKQAKKELEDAKAIADFWLAYKKEAQKISDNSRPSNLNFGLI